MVWLVVLVVAALALVAAVADGRARLGRSRRPAPGEVWHTEADPAAAPPLRTGPGAAPAAPAASEDDGPAAGVDGPAPVAASGVERSGPVAAAGVEGPGHGIGRAVLVLAVRTRTARVADLTAVPGPGTLPLPPGTTAYPRAAEPAAPAEPAGRAGAAAPVQPAAPAMPAHVDPATRRDVPVTALLRRAGAVPRDFLHRVDHASR